MVKFTNYVNDKYCPRCHGRSRLAFIYGRSTVNVQRLRICFILKWFDHFKGM